MLARILLATAGLAAAVAQAGGPLLVCAPGIYATYPSPFTVSLNYDGGGTLGSRTKAQADAIVNNAIAQWTNVSTARISLLRGPDLPVDVTTSNVNTYYNNVGDHLNPVIYDTDGSIIDLKLGVGASGSVLGFAGSSAAFNGSVCSYTEGQAVINGKIAVSDTTMTVVLAHELGHFIGLDHTDLNADQGLSSANFPLMYPVAYRSSATLADDDVSAVTSLYPDTNVAANYGTLQGNFRNTSGTQVPGANIWAKENTSGKLYSVVSDYLTQSNGAFKMLLPPGTYTLHASALDATDAGTGFELTSGSGVGPYSGDITDASFQPPLYSGANGTGTPLNVVLGSGTPTQVVITAGCVATADFRINGTGSVTGNCSASPPPPPLPPPPSDAHLANLSTRMQVLTGNNVMIGGFVIGGSANKTVAITATGPSLAAFGITNPLANPALTLVRSSDQSVVATNDDWQTDANASLLQSSGFAPS
ncbi:MAG TPA: carboxypeptidase regulatory-like domain-containing protein, partial [Gemmatimonadaceae bacterium]|nr:carboxypeptidase regulatory-like domain-containing protein [Gemmatimonadaceae bacterium]